MLCNNVSLWACEFEKWQHSHICAVLTFYWISFRGLLFAQGPDSIIRSFYHLNTISSIQIISCAISFISNSFELISRHLAFISPNGTVKRSKMSWNELKWIEMSSKWTKWRMNKWNIIQIVKNWGIMDRTSLIIWLLPIDSCVIKIKFIICRFHHAMYL